MKKKYVTRSISVTEATALVVTIADNTHDYVHVTVSGAYKDDKHLLSYLNEKAEPGLLYVYIANKEITTKKYKLSVDDLIATGDLVESEEN